MPQKKAHYVFIALDNQCRQNKKESDKRYRKPYENRYNLITRRLRRHIDNMAERCGFIPRLYRGHLRNNDYPENPRAIFGDPDLREKFFEFQAKLVRYHRGSKVHKLKGRLQKIQRKEMLNISFGKNPIAQGVELCDKIVKKASFRIALGLFSNQ